MKFLFFWFVCLIVLIPVVHLQAQVGVGTSSPDPSAQFEIKSDNKGFLIPRVTNTSVVSKPAKGLLIYQTSPPEGFYYNSGTPVAPNWLLLRTGSSPDGNASIDSLKRKTRTVKPVGFLNTAIASSWSGYNGFSNGSARTGNYRYFRIAHQQASAIQLCYGNFSDGEAIGPNSFTLTASLTTSTGLQQCTWNGVPYIVLAPGQICKTDPAYGLYTVGTPYEVKTFVRVAASGQKWPLGLTTNSLNSNEGQNTSGVDQTMNVQAVYSSNVQGYHPYAVIGIPVGVKKFVSTAVTGTSIAFGFGDNIDMGWVQRFLHAAMIPFTRHACNGSNMKQWTGIEGQNQYAFKPLQIGGAEVVLTEHGTNEAWNDNDVAGMKAIYLTYFDNISATGARIVACTDPPRSWTGRAETNRLAINTWLKTKPHPALIGIIDIDSLVSTSPGSGRFKTGYSADNTHLTPTGATAVGAACVTLYTKYFLNGPDVWEEILVVFLLLGTAIINPNSFQSRWD